MAIPAPFISPEDPVSKSEWFFLLSSLQYFEKITNQALKSKVRLEVLCLMHNFCNGNMEAVDVSDENRKAVHDKKRHVEKLVARTDQPSMIDMKKEKRDLPRRSYPSS